MRVKKSAVLLLCAALLPLSGCSRAEAALPYAHEIEDTVLMGALGVDLKEGAPGRVAVTVSSGGRSGAGDSPGQSPVVLSAQAETVSAACAEMQTFGSDFVFFGDVEHVLVGEEQALTGVMSLLGHMARDPELRLEARLWVIKDGRAGDILFDAASDGGAPDRLTALETDAELAASPAPRTAREVLSDLLDNGCALLPALERRPSRTGDGAEGEYTVAGAGYAILRNGALAGWTGEEGALGADLLTGDAPGRILEFAAPSLAQTALRLTDVKTELTPSFTDGVLAGLAVTCRIEAQVAELRGADGLSEEGRIWLEERLAQTGEAAIHTALDLAQTLDADYLHLGRKAALAAPWRKAELETQWKAGFAALPISLTVTGQVARM